MTRPVWIFDLDDTLHDATARIFPHINRNMTRFVMRELQIGEEDAGALRQRYWQRYGATLLGLMRHHGTDPKRFLAQTHELPDLHAMVVREPALRHALRRLPGHKLVFSNAPQGYAEAVLDAMGIRGLFDMVFSIERMRYRPKPSRAAFQSLLHASRIEPARCVLVEDSADNLRAAKALGMRTVWISRSTRTPAFVDLRLRSVIELPHHLSRF